MPKNQKKPLSKKLFLSAAAMCLALIAGIGAAFAWFSLNEESRLSGVDFHSEDTRINFGETVIVSRGFEGSDNKTTQSFQVSNATVPLNYKELLPGEYIEFELTLETKSILTGYKYTLGFSGLNGTQFTPPGREEKFSVLGLYRLKVADFAGEYPSDLPEMPKKWLADFDGQNAHANPKVNDVKIMDKTPWQGAEVISVKFKLIVDFSQFEILRNETNYYEYQKDISEAFISASIYVRLDR